jgi:uncharacterized protein YjbI with pentapeptide repeats
VKGEERRLNSKSGWKPWKPALESRSESEKKSVPWRPTKRQVLWVIGMVVALLTTALLIVNLYPEIWKSLLEERNLTLIALGVSVTAIIVLLAIGGAASRWTGFRGMTVRDWLDLLVVPLALVVISFLFTTQQDQRQQRTETQRAEAERELAEHRAQDEALQAYLDQMGNLLLGKNLRTSEENSEVRTLARARTLTVLARLDPSRKADVMQFLVEAELVQGVDGGPIISLEGASLRGADLSDAGPSARNLSKQFQATREAAEEEGASKREALAAAQVSIQVGADQSDAFQVGADLSGANLSDADLSGANLSEADLSVANLSGAALSNAALSNAALSGALGITDEQLAKQAKSLEGATMPNGQKYEDWLKDKKAREGDG